MMLPKPHDLYELAHHGQWRVLRITAGVVTLQSLDNPHGYMQLTRAKLARQLRKVTP